MISLYLIWGVASAVAIGPGLYHLFILTAQNKTIPWVELGGLIFADLIYLSLSWIALNLSFQVMVTFASVTNLLASGLFLYFSWTFLVTKTKASLAPLKNGFKPIFLLTLSNLSLFVAYTMMLNPIGILTIKEQAGYLFLYFFTFVVTLILVLSLVKGFSRHINAYQNSLQKLAGVLFFILGSNFILKAFI